VPHSRQPPAPQSPEAELANVQQVLDALEACPPSWWAESVFWWGLRRLYQARLRRTQAAHQRSSLVVQESMAGGWYDAEPRMMPIPAGEFLMGSDPQADRNALNAEQPPTQVYLPAYSLSRTPITNLQYAAFVAATGYEPPRQWRNGKPRRGREHHPVVRTSWYDAVAYCRWLSQLTGKPYRLPTEAEWEKGARGADGSIYPWGDTWDSTRCNTKEGGPGDTTPVEAYPQGASPYGLLGMAGNVWEWTSSLYWEYPYRADDGREDLTSPDARVLRGGSWLNLYDSARAACRRHYIPAYHSRIHGFRCCLGTKIGDEHKKD
jgi:formylglycine-generating enzyme required for sulfatase activity